MGRPVAAVRASLDGSMLALQRSPNNLQFHGPELQEDLRSSKPPYVRPLLKDGYCDICML